MKTLNDIKQDMSDLYDGVASGTMELKTASELANIAGKFLKAEQLDLAREIFLSGRTNTSMLPAPASQRLSQ
jgi:hypothetical protein